MDVLQTLCASTAPLTLCWLGNDGWLLYDGKTLVGFDLDLESENRLQPSPIRAEELAARLDVLMITHGHTDHLRPESCKKIKAGGRCHFIVPESCRYFADALGLRAQYVAPGQRLTAAGLQIGTVRALHGHYKGSVYGGASMLDCGYVLQMGGKTVYQPGDTVLLEEHFSLQGIDVLFVSPTEHNMQVEKSLELIAQTQPQHIVLQHFGTYPETAQNRFWTHGYVQELAAALPARAGQRLHIPTLGECIALTD